MLCPICQQESYCSFSMFNEVPFVDGKFYDNMCFCCASVPNTYEFDEKTGTLEVFRNYSGLHINTKQQMLEQGWSETDTNISLTAVEKIVGKPFRILGDHVFESLIILEYVPLAEVTSQ